MKLSKKQAKAISFAFTAHAIASKKLENGDMKEYTIWENMRDDKLKSVFGMTYQEIHDHGYNK